MSDYPPVEKILIDLLNEVRGLRKDESKDSSYYPWEVIPPQGKAFDATSTPPIVTPTVAAGETTVLVLQCPLGWDGIVKRLSNNYIGGTDPDTTGSLTWRVYLDRQLVPNYGNIQVQFGTPAFPRDTDGIFFSSGQTLKWTVTNIDPALPTAGSFCSCCLAGFWWPRQFQL